MFRRPRGAPRPFAAGSNKRFSVQIRATARPQSGIPKPVSAVRVLLDAGCRCPRAPERAGGLQLSRRVSSRRTAPGSRRVATTPGPAERTTALVASCARAAQHVRERVVSPRGKRTRREGPRLSTTSTLPSHRPRASPFHWRDAGPRVAVDRDDPPLPVHLVPAGCAGGRGFASQLVDDVLDGLSDAHEGEPGLGGDDDIGHRSPSPELLLARTRLSAFAFRNVYPQRRGRFHFRAWANFRRLP